MMPKRTILRVNRIDYIIEHEIILPMPTITTIIKLHISRIKDINLGRIIAIRREELH